MTSSADASERSGVVEKKPIFIFVIHFHQPIGQLDEVLERLFENSYKPLMNTLLKYRVPVALHFSGPLLLYAEKHYPDFLEMVRKAGDSGFPEFVGGAYSEAILPLIPIEDRAEQVKKYNKLFQRLIGDYPLRGFWLPERFWDQTIPSIISKFGYEYVFIDDQLLYMKGLKWSDSKYLWITEDSGKPLKIFFIDTEIRYKLPWSPVPEVIEYISKISSLEGYPYVLWGSDAEKFGEWKPWDVTGKWLEEFLQVSTTNNKYYVLRPKDYLRLGVVRGLTYLPHGSYDKMMEWSGGLIWNFLTKYSESNNMHKKLIYVRDKVLEAEASSNSRLEDAWDYIHLAECNDVYWHGLFGGTYIHHLRAEVYRNLIRAENIADKILRSYGIKKKDFDFDGVDEVLIEGELLNAYVKPSDGGTLFELDYREYGKEGNLINTMSRYPETYLSNVPYYTHDTYRRASFRDFIVRNLASLREWVSRSGGYTSENLVMISNYAVSKLRESSIIMTSSLENLEIIKEYQVSNSVLKTTYYLSDSPESSELLLIEMSFSPYSLNELRLEVGEEVIETGRYVETDKFIVVSKSNTIRVELSEVASLWGWKQVTLSRTEKGVKESLQGLTIALGLKIKDLAREYFQVKLYVT
ncbi:MAG: alpha-amylase/4-alpha-glucanotransferase domain-containing protein [Desulfurococcaceae archaeon TW002]